MSFGPGKPRPPLPLGPVLVVGLARSGQAAARLLAARGIRVVGCDAGSPDGAERLREAGVEVHLQDQGKDLLPGMETVVKSPGVPAGAPVIAAARERGLDVMGELELAWRALPNAWIAITGTNGKTTTTEWLGHVHRTAGLPSAVAGNVGTPLASLVDSLDGEATVICEASSFQLEDTIAFSPECGVLLNLAPDHLDRHSTLDEYLAAKLRVFANQSNDDVAVFNADDPAFRDRDLGGCARRVAFGEGADPELAVAHRDGTIFAGDEPLIDAAEIALPGPHNRQNAMAVAAAALSTGIEADAVREGLATFGGVPHRLEPVGERDGVRFVNDSKATNVASTLVALRSCDAPLRLILGGSLKGERFGDLAEPVAERCSGCYLVGEAAELLAEDLGPAASRRGLELVRCEDLGAAVGRAAADAGPGEVVLLSPACASFDAYTDFEARGEHFRRLVEELG